MMKSEPEKQAASAGTIAIDLVTKTLCHTGSVKSRNPSITNWPAYVAVMVALYPAARRPMAHMYFALSPKVSARAFEASSKERSSTPG